MNILPRKRLPFLLAAASLLYATSAYALFDLQVSPRRGGQHIRFEESEPGSLLRNEEITVTANTNVSVPYQISYRLNQPLTNERGEVIPQGDFIMFSPSTTLGTLRVEQETPIQMGQVTIYTSNGGGEADSFVLVLNVRVPENQSGGTYHTQITFGLEPLTPQSGASPNFQTLDVRVEIRPQFRLDVRSAKGGRKIDLGRITKDRTTGADTLRFEIQSNTGSSFRILQQMTEPLFSAEGQTIDDAALTALVQGENGGNLRAAGSPEIVSRTPVAVYQSETGGNDTFEIVYALNPPAEQKAGLYTGMINFSVDSNSPVVSAQNFNVPVQVNIDSILDLRVEMEDKSSGLAFGRFKGSDGAKERKVQIAVRSNLGKPYQLSQVVSRKLMNPQGEAIPGDNFVVSGDKPETGTLIVQAPTPVQEGESTMFISDALGTPEKLILNYSLRVPYDQRGGNYSSEIKYSITTL